MTVKIGWVGVHAEGLSAFKAVCEAEYDIMGMMTLVPDKADRRCGSGSYDELCERFDVPMFEVRHINDGTSIDILKSWDCDLLVVLGWGQILSEKALSQATIGAVGAHASILPHNRGGAPVNWAIINGETETGNSLMWLADDVDTGNLIAQQAFPITPYDTCTTIYDRVADSNREMLLDLLLHLEAGERPGQPQQDSGDDIVSRRRPIDGLINWDSSSRNIYNLIRALARPYPGAFAYLNGQSYKIWNAAVLPLTKPLATPGTVLGPVMSPEEKSCGLMVATADGALTVLEIEDETGRILNGKRLSGLSQLDRTGSNLSHAA